MIRNKKGAETLTLIIWIALGLVIFVFLMVGLTTGWTNLWNKLQLYMGGGSNVADLKQVCGLACDSKNNDDFCLTERTVKTSGGEKLTGLSCADYVSIPEVGVDSCGQVNCPKTTTKAVVMENLKNNCTLAKTSAALGAESKAKTSREDFYKETLSDLQKWNTALATANAMTDGTAKTSALEKAFANCVVA